MAELESEVLIQEDMEDFFVSGQLVKGICKQILFKLQKKLDSVHY